MASTIFSDSWYRVSGMRVSLLGSVTRQEQIYRDKLWYVLQDTYSQRFFRASAETYAFINALVPSRTVEEVWRDFVELHPETAPSQEETIQLLTQLHASNLLFFQQEGDSESIYKRFREQKSRERWGQIASFLFFRVPIWNPDRWLEKLTPWIHRLTGIPAMVVWLFVVIWGSLATFENRHLLSGQSEGLLALGNLPWLYVCLSLMKLVHETAHGFVCKRYGGEVRTFGVMFLLLTPMPYVDATSSWSFTNRWHRVYVGVAGMAIELFMAAIAALVWTKTGPGLVNSLAFNVMVIGSVSSLLFNGNPLLRFDAYYMLSDYAGIPNLYQKGQQQWLYFGDRYVLGTRDAFSPAQDAREWHWLTAYGLLSFIYMMIVTVGISLFLLDQWVPLGLFALGMTLFSKFVMPVKKLASHLRSQKVQANRKRALVTLTAIFSILIFTAGWIPLPFSIKASGVIEAHQSTIYYAPVEGILKSVASKNGAHVSKGQALAVLTNPELEQDILASQYGLQEAEAQYRIALFRAPNEIAATQQRLIALRLAHAELERRLALLTVYANHDGEWVSPSLHEFENSWVHRGQILGDLIDRTQFRFSAVIPQEQANELFKYSLESAELMLAGQTDRVVPLLDCKVIPYQSQKLSSSALGWMGGGDIAVKTDDKDGNIAQEPFYVIHGTVPADAIARLSAFHGISGLMRVELPGQPLYWQLKRSFLQLIQKRYGV
jgi:putative peptide zinc metalloprotease protein